MRAARFEVSPELLFEALHAPAGTSLRYAGVTEYGNLVLIVDHPDIPEADTPHTSMPTVTKEAYKWDWGLS